MTHSQKKKLGRPAILKSTVTVRVTLEKEQLETAELLGEGNLSAGIRESLKFSKVYLKKLEDSVGKP